MAETIEAILLIAGAAVALIWLAAFKEAMTIPPFGRRNDEPRDG